MPTYGYQCKVCGNAFEVVQKITDDPLTICETCGGELRKKIFPVGIAFKGSGFYVNDYGKTAPASPAGGSDAAPAAEAKADSPTPIAAEPASSAPDKTPAAPAPAAAPAASTP